MINPQRMITKACCFKILFFLFQFINAQVPDAEIIKYYTDCHVKKGKLIVQKTYLIQINNRAGETFSNVYINYKLDNKINFQEAWIENIYGQVIRKLKKSEIKDRNQFSKNFYTDYMQKYFTLKHNQYPYRIYYQYSIVKNDFLKIAEWTPAEYNVPVQDAKLTIEIPEDYLVKIKENNISHQKIQEEGKIIYLWKSEYLKKITKENYSPSLKETILKYVLVVPVYFKYGVNGSNNSWEEFGFWIYNLNKGLNTLPENEVRMINDIVEPFDNKRDKIKVLYKYLQDNNRYVNIAVGIGGLKSYPAQYVVTNKYGDCKALSNYMKSMLDCIGIESHWALVNAGSEIEMIDENFPAQQFNHVIICVPEIYDTIWLECTSKITPFNYLGCSSQGRSALLVKKEGSTLVKTPSLYEKDVTEEGEYLVSFIDRNNVIVKTSNRFSGPMFEYLNNVQLNYNSDDQDKKIRNFFNFKNFDIKEWSIENVNRDSTYIILNAEIMLNNYIKTYGNNIIFELFQLDIPYFENPDKRELPVRISYPIHKRNKIIYQLPPYYKVLSQLNDTIIFNDYGRYSFNYEIKDDLAIITKDFVLFSGNYSLSGYKDFYHFMKTIYKFENKKITLIK